MSQSDHNMWMKFDTFWHYPSTALSNHVFIAQWWCDVKKRCTVINLCRKFRGLFRCNWFLESMISAVFFKYTSCWNRKTQGPQGHPPTPSLAGLLTHSIGEAASTNTGWAMKTWKLFTLQRCPLLLKAETVQKNSQSPMPFKHRAHCRAPIVLHSAAAS